MRALLVALISVSSSSQHSLAQTTGLHAGDFLKLMFSQDGKTIVSAGKDNKIRLFEAAAGKQLRVIDMHGESEISCLALSPDGKTLAASSDFGTIVLWNVSSGAKLRTLKVQSQKASAIANCVQSIAFSPDGKLLVSTDLTNIARIWDLDSGKIVHKVLSHSTAIAFSHDGKKLADIGDTNYVVIWNTDTGKRMHTMPAEANMPALAFNANDTLLAGQSKSKIKLWNVASGKEVREFVSDSASDYAGDSLAFGPGDNTLLSEYIDYKKDGSWVRNVRAWNMTSGQATSLMPMSNFRLVAFSLDAKMLASVPFSDGAAIKVWNVDAHKELRTLRGSQ